MLPPLFSPSVTHHPSHVSSLHPIHQHLFTLLHADSPLCLFHLLHIGHSISDLASTVGLEHRLSIHRKMMHTVQLHSPSSQNPFSLSNDSLHDAHLVNSIPSHDSLIHLLTLLSPRSHLPSLIATPPPLFLLLPPEDASIVPVSLPILPSPKNPVTSINTIHVSLHRLYFILLVHSDRTLTPTLSLTPYLSYDFTCLSPLFSTWHSIALSEAIQVIRLIVASIPP